MSVRNFRQMLEQLWGKDLFVCVGLDSDVWKIPANAISNSKYMCGADLVLAFNKAIIDATKDLVCAFKPNLAFYEALGAAGFEALRLTILYVHEVAPEVPVILDAKRADIGNTNTGYVRMAFEYFKADAITVHPYLGSEALKPFLDLEDKGIFVLCRTSNPGAGEFQDRIVIPSREDEARWQLPSIGRGEQEPCRMRMYEYVAHCVAHDWNKKGNCGLVVGATYPGELSSVRKIVRDMPILLPGIGAQGADVKSTVQAGKDKEGKGMVINSSRGVIFASDGEDFADAARLQVEKLHVMINQYRFSS